MSTGQLQAFYSSLPTKPRKAITALVVTLLGGVGAELIEGSVTWGELGAVVGTALVAAGAVWRIPNPVNVRKLTRGPNPQQLPPEAYSGGPRG